MKNLAKMFRERLGGHDVQEVACGCTNLIFCHLSSEQFDERLEIFLKVLQDHSDDLKIANFDEEVEKEFKNKLNSLLLQPFHSSINTKVHYCTCIPDTQGNCTCQQTCFKCNQRFSRNTMHFVVSKQHYTCRQCF